MYFQIMSRRDLQQKGIICTIRLSPEATYKKRGSILCTLRLSQEATYNKRGVYVLSD